MNESMTTGKVHYIPHHCVKKILPPHQSEWYMTAAVDNPDGSHLSMITCYKAWTS